jgi:hypothetical protein
LPFFLTNQPSKCDVLEVKLKDLRAAAQLVSNFTSTREIAALTDTLMTDVSLVTFRSLHLVSSILICPTSRQTPWIASKMCSRKMYGSGQKK